MNKRICSYCGAQYKAAVTSRYCSQACASKAARARQKRGVTDKGLPGKTSCAYCGTGYDPKHPARRYCGQACKQAAFRDRQARRAA